MAKKPLKSKPVEEEEEDLEQEEEQDEEQVETEANDEESEEAEFDQALDVIQGHLQRKYARRVAGPVGDHNPKEGWIDELALPIILAIINWLRNRNK